MDLGMDVGFCKFCNGGKQGQGSENAVGSSSHGHASDIYHTHTHTHTHTVESYCLFDMKIRQYLAISLTSVTPIETHTHTHTHTQRERERDRLTETETERVVPEAAPK